MKLVQLVDKTLPLSQESFFNAGAATSPPHQAHTAVRMTEESTKNRETMFPRSPYFFFILLGIICCGGGKQLQIMGDSINDAVFCRVDSFCI